MPYFSLSMLAQRLQDRSNGFNATKNVHGKSVEQSIQQSIQNLRIRYPEYDENSVDVFNQIKTFRNQLSTENYPHIPPMQLQATEHLLNRFLDQEDKNYINEVSLREALYLTWQCMHDSNFGQEEKSNLEILFIQYCYEIQRSYNINQDENDNFKRDNPAGNLGTRNKLLSVIDKIDSYVNIIYITDSTVIKKSQILLRKALLDFVKEENKKSHFNNFSQELNESRLSADTWQQLQPRLLNELVSEFGEFEIYLHYALSELAATGEWYLIDSHLKYEMQLLIFPSTAKPGMLGIPIAEENISIITKQFNEIYKREVSAAEQEIIDRLLKSLNSSSFSIEKKLHHSLKIMHEFSHGIENKSLKSLITNTMFTFKSLLKELHFQNNKEAFLTKYSSFKAQNSLLPNAKPDSQSKHPSKLS